MAPIEQRLQRQDVHNLRRLIRAIILGLLLTFAIGGAVDQVCAPPETAE